MIRQFGWLGCFFFQADDGIRDLVRSRGLGDVYKRQEVHCVSLWGHDFRPDYRFIAQAWQELGGPRILGMTATATPRVQDDVQAALGSMRLVTTGTHRPNLHLEARRVANEAEKREALAIVCRQHQGSGIVYATSREKCEDLAALLRRRGVKAIHYHAGIADRAAAQDRFMSGEARVVVATVAFGMGVDKSDVRFIVHYNPPKALENYYQEAGRAGRDGQPARCEVDAAAHGPDFGQGTGIAVDAEQCAGTRRRVPGAGGVEQVAGGIVGQTAVIEVHVLEAP